MDRMQKSREGERERDSVVDQNGERGGTRARGIKKAALAPSPTAIVIVFSGSYGSVATTWVKESPRMARNKRVFAASK